MSLVRAFSEKNMYKTTQRYKQPVRTRQETIAQVLEQ